MEENSKDRPGPNTSKHTTTPKAGQTIRNDKATVRLPILLGLTMAAGMLIGANFFGSSKSIANIGRGYSKFKEVLQLIENNYVDTVNTEELVDYSIQKMLEKLDPHTSYLNQNEAVAARTQLEGGFDGIGIEYNIYKDTVYVVTPLAGGPSETAGIQSGDKLIKVDETPLTGTKLDNGLVFQTLRGQRGTPVKLVILRKGEKKPLSFTVTRDRIPTYSVDAAYMIDDKTGYIKVNRFSETTYDEFKASMNTLKQQGMTQMVLDLRNNPGGYMDRATSLADEFIDGDKLLVYTDGKDNRYDRQVKARIAGQFEEGPVVVLIDEGSASASEIVAGALQDQDRALIVGRRSFGKGLVQMPIMLADGSELRLTISRYYTPSGRSIQKPYTLGKSNEEYEHELEARAKNGEYYIADSIKNDPKYKFQTSGGRTVYGAGGITPDVFVPRDTLYMTEYLLKLYNKNIIRETALEYANTNKKRLEKDGFTAFRKDFAISEPMMKAMIDDATSQGVKFNEKEFNRSKDYIRTQLKAYIAQYVWKAGKKDGLNNEFFQVMAESDDTFKQAMTLFDRARMLAKGNYTTKK
ncbi:S41 family peptidase [Tellurirhabdus bombi]|uniref:S41 family peptidase n=1 Tax=Tellurirhabdus bombi TaxID=2907205 RepID=UPI001F15B1DB|nr:S41 family peptidase [Tellurirhabdus bombi]